MGVGVCFGNGCNHGHIDDNPEIDASGRETVRLDISSLFSSFGSFIVNADSATNGEMLGIFASNATGTALGAKLGDATSAGGNVGITPTSNYLFFVADDTITSGADVLLHSLAVTPDAVPEPASVALLATALFGVGLLRRKERPVLARNEVGMAGLPARSEWQYLLSRAAPPLAGIPAAFAREPLFAGRSAAAAVMPVSPVLSCDRRRYARLPRSRLSATDLPAPPPRREWRPGNCR
jgi:hypothetical protein